MQSNLRNLRERNGITGAGLARGSGLSDQTIRRAEKGRVSTPTTLYRILNALNELAGKSYKLGDVFPDTDG